MHRIWETLRQLRRDQRGQDMIEYAAVLLVVAVVVVGGAALIPSVTGPVEKGMECEVQKIFGNACTAGAPGEPANEVLCRSSAETNDIKDDVTVLFIKLGHNVTLLKTLYSNGQVGYTLTDSGSAQAQYELIKAEASFGPVGFNAEVSAAAGGQLTGSQTFMFPSQAAAAQFEKDVKGAGGWGQVAHDVAGPVGGFILNHIGVHGAPSQADLASKYKQYLTGAYVGVGAVGELKGTASAELGPLQGQLNASLQGAGGARYIYGGKYKGDVALYINLTGSANAALMAGVFGPGAGANATGTAVVTVDPSGRPVDLNLNASASAGAGLNADGSQKGQEPGEGDEGPLLKKLNLKGSTQPGAGYLYTADVDLTKDPNATSDLLGVLNPVNATQGVSSLVSTVDTYGTQQIQPYQQTQSSSTAGIEGEISDIGGGVSATQARTNQTYNSGYVLPPGAPDWMPTICEK